MKRLGAYNYCFATFISLTFQVSYPTLKFEINEGACPFRLVDGGFMKKCYFLIVFLLLLNFVFSSMINPPKRGFIKNSENTKCWYKTKYKRGKYFTSNVGIVCMHIFEKPDLMTNDTVSKRLIADAVTGFYKGKLFQKDTIFEMDPDKWIKAKPNKLPKKGYVIKSLNYSTSGVFIDFQLSVDKKYITKVIHLDSYNY